MRERSAPGSLLFSLVFLVLVPGTVVGLVPYWLTGWRVEEPLSILRAAGAIVAGAGLASLLEYRHVRPMYVAVLALVVGQGLVLGSGALHTFLLRKGGADRVRRPHTDTGTGRGAGRRRIRCPRCGWEPGRDDRWACTCLHAWNTFETGGVCPACGRSWSETQCPRCGAWSRHEEWYEDETR